MLSSCGQVFFLSRLTVFSIHASFFTIINTKTTLSQPFFHTQKKSNNLKAKKIKKQTTRTYKENNIKNQ
ncbi:hypothetical protein BTN40_05645 [Escherichia coli]|nr:hypothetical protein BTN40_05645 [Escherichia coli]